MYYKYAFKFIALLPLVAYETIGFSLKRYFDNCNITESEKCYTGLGCVKLTREWFNSVHRPCNVMPAERHAINTIFVLWSFRDSKINSQIIGPDCLNHSRVSSPLKILVHDFTSNGYAGWIENFATIIYQTSSTNNMQIVSVDWAPGAEPPYIQAVANARLVALEIAQFLFRLKTVLNIDPNEIHGIGHGLGAHVLGYVGKLVTLQRITALDPSGPYFSRMPSFVRVDKDDADFVEVLHTDAGPDGQGSPDIWGHVDYFANGLMPQPSCEDPHQRLTEIRRDNLELGKIHPGCSHKRSVKYYIESLTKPACSFFGIACKSFKDFVEGKCTECGPNFELCSQLHILSPPRKVNNTNGFYFVTSNSSPYCVEMIKVSLKVKRTSVNSDIVKGYYEVTIPQSDGDVKFFINENGLIKALRTDRRQTFLVFRSTPPSLHIPIHVINLKWHPLSLPIFQKSKSCPPKLVILKFYGIADTSNTGEAQFCLSRIPMSTKLEASMVPCDESITYQIKDNEFDIPNVSMQSLRTTGDRIIQTPKPIKRLRLFERLF